MNEIIKRAQLGNKEAYLQLIEHYHFTVEKFAYQCGVYPQDINDVTQEVFIKLYRFLHQFNDSAFTTWLYKITLNTARDYYRKTTREQARQQKLQAQPAHSVPTPEQHVLRFEEDQQIHTCIQALDEKYRYPIILFYFHELRYEQIAEVLAINLSTVKVRILRAKAQLKVMLETEGKSSHG
ncbi:RNA polymerase sigma factor [Lysinibacillus sp. BF-4]|uniref:RNA polymerase sigma factor n=1 Tax=Lysinibacillus sp. BF-4 TaxID=1473546 RepID=UPI000504109E|nr:RNA polymerase sigma factor [Lysinibacillus sp. BF-4]